MKKLILLSLTALFALQSYAQNQTDIVEIKKGFGIQFLQNGKKLTPKQLNYVMQGNDNAYTEMKKARTYNGVGTAFGLAGGFLIGYPLGSAIAGGEPNWIMAGIGAGLAVISIPFSVAYTKHVKTAVHIYNDNLAATDRYGTDLKLELSGNGLSLVMRF